MHAALPVELNLISTKSLWEQKGLSQYSGCWWGLLSETWPDTWAPARTDFMPSAWEAPLAADRGESAPCATTSTCSGDWFFGFWVSVEDTSKTGGLNRITVWISPEMTRFSSTPQLSLSVLESDFRFSSLTILAQILVSVCLFFILITLPKTPAIQDVKIKNKSNWCPWKICCQFQPWTP